MMELHKFTQKKYVGEVILWDGKLETIQRLISLYPNYSFAEDCEEDFLIVRSKTDSIEKYILDLNDKILCDEYAKVSKNSFLALDAYLSRNRLSMEEFKEHYELGNNGDLYVVFRYSGYLWDGTIEMYHAIVEEYGYSGTWYIEPSSEFPSKYILMKLETACCDCGGNNRVMEAQPGEYVNLDSHYNNFKVVDGRVYLSSEYEFINSEEC